MAKIFPTTWIYVAETDETFGPAIPVVGSNDQFQIALTLDANTTETDKVYELEVYTGNDLATLTATGITTSVTVVGINTALEAYAVEAAQAMPDILPATGGKSTVYVKFTVPSGIGSEE